MIYSLNFVKDTKTTVEENTVDRYFTSIGIELIEEADNEFRNIMLSTHGVKPLNEGFDIKKNLSKIKDIVAKIIKFLIKAIKDIIARFNMFIAELFADKNKLIEKYKNKLANMPAEFEISKYTDIQYYNYTYLEADIPDPNLYLMFSENYEVMMGEIKKIANLITKQEIIAAINRLESSIDTGSNSSYLMSVRSSIINSGNNSNSTAITAEMFPERLFMLYRDGASSGYQGKLIIPPNQVKKSCDRCLNYKATLNRIDKQRAAIEKASSDIEKKFDKLTAKFILNKEDFDIEIALDRLCRKKVVELSELCSVFVMAFSAKIDACKECYIMDKKICMKAITHIVTKDLEED